MCSMLVRHDFLAYEQDSEDEDLEASRIVQLLESVPSDLQIKRFTRLGFRRRYLVPTGMTFSEMVSVFELKFVSPKHMEVQGIPQKLEDLMYRADMRDGEDRFHIALGPAQKRELPAALGFNHERHLDPSSPEQLEAILDSYPEVSLFMDVDLYRDEDEYEVSTARAFYDAARVRMHELSMGYAEYCFSQKVS